MSGNSEKHQGQQRTAWYADPRANAIIAIAGVGVALAGVLVAVVLWVLGSLETDNEKVPPAADLEKPASNGREPSAEPKPGELPEADPKEMARNGETSGIGGNRFDLNQDFTLSPETDFSQVIRGRAISLEEDIDARQPVYIAASRVNLSSGAVLRAPRIWIFADEITGGRLDVSGVDGTTDDRDGAPAGSIYLFAKRIDGVGILADGGNGISGGKGESGPAGADGSCAESGAWSPPQPGGNGKRGESGGDGGSAGDVRIVYGDLSLSGIFSSSPGSGADGGPGGDGGAGGDGCNGSGGWQAPAKGGSPGLTGTRGSNGAHGSQALELKPQLVADTLEWLSQRPLPPETLEYARRCELEGTALR